MQNDSKLLSEIPLAINGNTGNNVESLCILSLAEHLFYVASVFRRYFAINALLLLLLLNLSRFSPILLFLLRG